MIERLSITVLADNYVAARNLLGEHGLSLLGIDLSELDAVVLSHGHFDHTGGLSDLLRDFLPTAISLHLAALQPKYARSDNAPHRFIGIPEPSRHALSAVQYRVVWTESATEVVPYVWCTGGVPRLAANGPNESGFFLDWNCLEPDPLADDQALFIETTSGLVVIAGCAHAGIASTLDRAGKLTGRNEFFGLVGGLHFWRATHQELNVNANAVGRRKFQVIAPCHCTRTAANAYHRTRFHSLMQDVGVGARLHFGER